MAWRDWASFVKLFTHCINRCRQAPVHGGAAGLSGVAGSFNNHLHAFLLPLLLPLGAMSSTSRHTLPGFDFFPSQSGWLPTAPAELADAPQARLMGSVPRYTRAPQLQSLTPAAHAWLTALPPRYQPLATARRHPHIVNRLSALWDVPEQLPAYLQDLLLANRPGREGFSFDVLTELTDLQSLIELAMQRASRA